MKLSLSLGRLSFLALMLWTPAAFADAVCTAGPSCPGYSPTPLGPLPAVEGIQGVLPSGVFVTAGDVLLTDLSEIVPPPPCSATAPTFCSDVLRFFDIGNGTAHFYLLFSDNPGTEPPDTGLPPSIQANNFTMDEVGGPLYTAGGASYLIMSDTTPSADVPEPSTLLFMGLVTVFLLLAHASGFRISAHG
jgi:hypothetical protein